MNPKIKCTCPFGKPSVAIAENCPVHGGMKNDYPLIPMKDITDEARLIAVAWMEEDDRKFIANKHKLASDIMNYARRHNKALHDKLQQWVNQNVKDTFEIEELKKQLAFKDEEIKMLKHLHK